MLLLFRRMASLSMSCPAVRPAVGSRNSTLVSRGGFLRSFAASIARPGPPLFATRCVSAPARHGTARAPVAKEEHGFELMKQEFIAEYGSLALLYRHKKTGAEVMSLLNDDENKVFGVVLRTPPKDSKGVPHILEHSVLCGSRKYPIKEPFVELIKGSLNTFLNAFTYPDRTCYPVASCNLTDFYNLMDVYLDAVFHPKCVTDEMTFLQEGWHHELDAPGGTVTYKGVVFNEMKGVYSQPDSVLGRDTQQALFPDTTYGVDSGGDPTVIPSLTFAEFGAFHARFYHPSNARFWFSGDDDASERLRRLGAVLDEFGPRDVDSDVATQSLWSTPRREVKYYPAGEEAAGEQRAYLTLNWVLSDKPLGLQTELALGFLDHLLLGTSASPLRKALTESGLGEAVVGGGLEDELKQMTFSVGLKGVAPEDIPKVEALITSELERAARDGFTQAAVDASVNTIEFGLRENNTGSFPRGLSLMLRSVGSWLYGRDPVEPLKFEAPLAELKARLAAGDKVFEPLITTYLLSNPHRLTLELRPDAELGARAEVAEAKTLDDFKSRLSPQSQADLVATTAALKKRQETPDPPSAVECMPALSLGDIPRVAPHIPREVTLPGPGGGATHVRHEQPTNGVLYADVLLDLSPVPAPLLPLVPLFCRMLLETGAGGDDFVALSQRLGSTTGGLYASASAGSKRGTPTPVAHLYLRGKAMRSQAGELTRAMGDVLTSARLGDKERFKQMALEAKSGLEAAAVGRGHSLAAGRLDAQRSLAGAASERMGGVSYLRYLRELLPRVESDWDAVHASLLTLRGCLLQRRGAIINLTADAATLAAAEGPVGDLLTRLPMAATVSPGAGWLSLATPPRSEALVVPTQVNYVAKAANLYADAGYTLHGSAYVASKHLGTSYLWDKVRVVGGAYGGFCDWDPHSGMWTYLSYRDPNLLGTLEAYDGAPDFLRGLDMTPGELERAVIGTMGDVDAYQLPDAKGATSLQRWLLGVTDEERQARREEILGTTVSDLRRFADALDCVRGPAAKVVAVVSAEAAAEASRARPGWVDETMTVL